MKLFWPVIIALFFPLSCGKGQGSVVESVDKSNNSGSTISTTQQPIQAAAGGHDCGYDNAVESLGIGLIIPPPQFELYNDSLLVNMFARYDMYELDEGTTGICSKFFKPDYGIMHFVCTRKTPKAYQVLRDYAVSGYFPKTKDYQFITWEDYILQSYGIRRHVNEAGELSADFPLRIKPMDNANTIAIPKGYEMFCPMAVKGEWVNVKFDCFYNEENNPHEGKPCHDFIKKCNKTVTGWLRWRQGNKLLIDIFLMP